MPASSRVRSAAARLAALLLGLAAAAGAQEEAPPAAVHGAPAAFDGEATREPTVWVAAGSVLHSEAARATPAIARLDVAAELPLLERRGPWAQVRWRGRTGWVLLEGADDDPLAYGLRAPPSAVALSNADGALLAATARRLLGSGGRSEPMAGYTLLTDVADRRLLARLAAIAERLPAAFAARYGLSPPPGDGQTVVLFAGHDRYRALARAHPTLAGTIGHSSGDLAVLAVGLRPPAQLEALWIHELSHLIVHRTFGQVPPQWLDEGLAEDLAYCRVERDGALALGTLGNPGPGRVPVARQRRGGRLVVTEEARLGGVYGRRHLRRGWRQHGAGRLAALVRLERGTGDVDHRFRYALGAFLVRYLLDSGDPARAEGFRAYLRAAGDPPLDADALPRMLGTDWSQLEQGLARWAGVDDG